MSTRTLFIREPGGIASSFYEKQLFMLQLWEKEIRRFLLTKISLETVPFIELFAYN